MGRQRIGIFKFCFFKKSGYWIIDFSQREIYLEINIVR